MTSTNGQGHTAGPWSYDRDAAEIYFNDNDVCPLIAIINREGTSQEQADADGALIASAPDLLEALAFYADPRRYRGPNQKPIENDRFAKEGEVYICDVTRDGGEIARAALSRVSGEGR